MTLVSRVGRPFVEPPITEEEIKVVIEEGADAGVIEETEQEMVSRLFRLSDRAVEALMRPRRDIVCLDINDHIEENLMLEMANASRTHIALVVDECGGRRASARHAP